MGHAGSEEGKRVEAFRLELLLGAFARLGDIANEHDETQRLDVIDARHVKIKVSVFRVKNLQVPADDGAWLEQFVPVQTAQPVSQPLANDLLLFQAKKHTRSAVDIGDPAFGIQK